MNLFSE